MQDKIEIEILADGTIKMSTDKISAANHGGAEMLLREIVTMAGGQATRKGKAGFAQHTHTQTNGKTITHSH